MSYLRNQFLSLSYIFFKTDTRVVHIFLEYALLFLDDNVDENNESISNSKSLASLCFLGFA